MPGQGAKWHVIMNRQWMIAMHRQHQRIATEHPANQPRVIEQLRRRRNIDPVLFQRFKHLLGIADFHRHLHLRQTLAKGFHQVEDVIRRRGGNAQCALDLAAVTQEKLDVGFLLHQHLDHRQQPRALLTDAETPAAAIEQLDRVLTFEVADLRRHRRLAQAELFGSLGNAAQAGHHVKRLQLGTQHNRPSSFTCAAGANR
ncbi:hypothetical protein D3C80_970900 [compost metagenome]